MLLLEGSHCLMMQAWLSMRDSGLRKSRTFSRLDSSSINGSMLAIGSASFENRKQLLTVNGRRRPTSPLAVQSGRIFLTGLLVSDSLPKMRPTLLLRIASVLTLIHSVLH